MTPAYLQQAYDLTYLSATRGSGDTVAIVGVYNDAGRRLRPRDLPLDLWLARLHRGQTAASSSSTSRVRPPRCRRRTTTGPRRSRWTSRPSPRSAPTARSTWSRPTPPTRRPPGRDRRGDRGGRQPGLDHWRRHLHPEPVHRLRRPERLDRRRHRRQRRVADWRGRLSGGVALRDRCRRHDARAGELERPHAARHDRDGLERFERRLRHPGGSRFPTSPPTAAAAAATPMSRLTPTRPPGSPSMTPPPAVGSTAAARAWPPRSSPPSRRSPA